MRRFVTLLALLLAFGGCVPRAQPPAPPPPRPAPVVALPPPPLSADWRDWPVTPGTWAYRRDARGSIALFGFAAGEARLTLRCDMQARQVYLSREGSGAAPLAIRTSTATRALPVRPSRGTPPYVEAPLSPSDALLDAIAFSRGRFVVEHRGAPTLVVPAWPEIGRVIEDCRG